MFFNNVAGHSQEEALRALLRDLRENGAKVAQGVWREPGGGDMIFGVRLT